MTRPLSNWCGYFAGHSWYYVLGGDIPTIKQIHAYAQVRNYCGYRADDIDAANAKPEPQRTRALEKIRADVHQNLKADISCYREVARELRAFRRERARTALGAQPRCEAVHTSVSLKFCHIQNGFTHLKTLDALPAQLSLF